VKSYDRKTLAKPGNAFLIGAAVLGMAWNTSAFPQGLKDLPDILNPSLKGRIGVPNPTSPSFIDWYLWVQSTYGKNFLPKLAAQDPKIYASSLTMTQAVASGELSASPFTAGTAVDLKDQGAPIAFKLAHGLNTWNAPFYAMVLKGSPHPAAAQVLSNYMVTKEAMGLAQHHSGSVLKGVPGTFYVKPRNQKLSDFTPKKIEAFQSYWNSLFKK
jgi:iron(III) transport system substrate-binding protein